mmetsp:Transcript_6869/g.41890  ORF Transcript_6869/g.41890 Transcript_6869/m.41890 type:complete len:247 (+) Transcript_6869:2857-3597(+)
MDRSTPFPFSAPSGKSMMVTPPVSMRNKEIAWGPSPRQWQTKAAWVAPWPTTRMFFPSPLSSSFKVSCHAVLVLCQKSSKLSPSSGHSCPRTEATGLPAQSPKSSSASSSYSNIGGVVCPPNGCSKAISLAVSTALYRGELNMVSTSRSSRNSAVLTAWSRPSKLHRSSSLPAIRPSSLRSVPPWRTKTNLALAFLPAPDPAKGGSGDWFRRSRVALVPPLSLPTLLLPAKSSTEMAALLCSILLK